MSSFVWFSSSVSVVLTSREAIIFFELLFRARVAGFKDDELANADSINEDLCDNGQATRLGNDGTTQVRNH